MRTREHKTIIYELRKRAGLTQEETAKRIGVKLVTYLKWEHDEGNPSAINVEKMARLFNVSTEDFGDVYARCNIKKCDNLVYRIDLCAKHYIDMAEYFIEFKTPEPKPTMGERFKEARESRFMDVKDMAKIFGVTVGTVHAWEDNRVTPTLHMLLDIASFFGLSTRYFERGEMENGTDS